MAIELIDKIKQKNNGTFKLIDAVDVEMSNGSDAESTINDISKKLNEHMENHPSGEGTATANVHVGDNPPEDEELVAWIDTSDDDEIVTDIADLLLEEFRDIFSEMQKEILYLKSKTIELETRLYLLETNGPSSSAPTDLGYLLAEDGSVILAEDGTEILLEV